MATRSGSILRSILVLLGLLLLVVVGTGFWYRNFIERAMTYPAPADITTPEWYTPKAKVAGNFKKALPTADSLTISQTALDKLSDYTQKQHSTALLVLHKGQLVLEKYWGNSHQDQTSNSMSMVKTMMGVLTGMAIEDGKIGSEMDLVADYIEEWKGDERDKITIQDLLYMQSGLRNEDNGSDPRHDLCWMYAGPNVLKTTLEIPAIKPAGEIYEYNNANSQMLGIIIERATGVPIEEYASEKIWKRIGAKDAGWWIDRPDGMPKTFCCYFARARDWARMGKMLMDGGKWEGQQVVPAQWVKKMLIPSKLERDYGYQLWLGFEAGGRKDDQREEMPIAPLFTMDGREKQQVYMIPSEDLVIVRIGEEPDAWDEGYFPNILLRDLQAQRAEKAATTSTEDLTQNL
ncbi:MAG: serine hydrolase [Bacteroidota bacterium]